MRILIDLDNTLCEQCPIGDTSAMFLAKPITKNVEALRELEKHNEIIVYTARLSGGLDNKNPSEESATRTWLHKNNIPYDSIVFDKPWCDYMIDDRATTFDEICKLIQV